MLGGAQQLSWLLSLRLVCVSWASVVLPMGAFPHARLVVPREVLSHCSPEFLAKACRAFGHKPEALVEVCVGRTKCCYPGPLAVSSIADSPDIASVAVVCRLGRSPSNRVPLKHLAGALARLLVAGKIVGLSLGTDEDRCSINELREIVRVFKHPALATGRGEVRGLHITHNPRLLGQLEGTSNLYKLIRMLPNLESIVIDHCGAPHYALFDPLLACIQSRRLSSLSLDGMHLEPHIQDLGTTFFPSTLETLSLRRVSVSARNFPSLVTNICALESIVSCNLSGAMKDLPNDACIDAIKGLINKPTLRNLDLSRNILFTNDYIRDDSLARAMLASPTLESLSIKAVCTPSHAVLQMILALPATRLSRFKISVGVYTTVISDYQLARLSERAPQTCAIAFGKLVV